MKVLFFVFVGICVLLLVVGSFEWWKIQNAIAKSKPLLLKSKSFERDGAIPGVLIAGDSTGVGTGATAPNDSIAGLLAHDVSGVSFKNVSVNGLRVAGLLAILKGLPVEKSYSLVLLQIGGNDIVNLTSEKQFRNDLRLALSEAKKRGERVGLMCCGDVGNAPAFGPLLSALFSERTRVFRDILLAESKDAGVTYVDLYEPKNTDPFAREPLRYHASDGFHPSSEGYALWYQKLKVSLKEAGVY